MVSLYNGTVLSNKTGKLLIPASTKIKFRCTAPGARSQTRTHLSVHSMSSSIGHSGKGNIPETKNGYMECPGLQMEEGLSTKEQEEVFWHDGDVLILKCGGDYTIVFLQTHRIVPWQGRVLLYVNDTSICLTKNQFSTP